MAAGDKIWVAITENSLRHCFIVLCTIKKWIIIIIIIIIVLIHRDMKPGNVMLAEDDTPVIMDFGSMGEARIEVKGRSEACALQVNIQA